MPPSTFLMASSGCAAARHLRRLVRARIRACRQDFAQRGQGDLPGGKSPAFCNASDTVHCDGQTIYTKRFSPIDFLPRQLPGTTVNDILLGTLNLTLIACAPPGPGALSREATRSTVRWQARSWSAAHRVRRDGRHGVAKCMSLGRVSG